MLNLKTTFIYKLVDPRLPEEVRYVGKSDNVETRLKAHIATAKRNDRKKLYVYNWIQSLLKEGIEPMAVVLEEVSYSTQQEWWARERHYIKLFKELGHPLTNLADGGAGSDSFSAEVKIRRSQGQIGKIFTAETRAKMSAIHKGKTISMEQRLKISNKLKNRPKGPFTQEHLANMREAVKNRVITDKFREAHLKAHLGRKASDAAKDKMRVIHKNRTKEEYDAINAKIKITKDRLRSERIQFIAVFTAFIMLARGEVNTKAEAKGTFNLDYRW